MSKYTVVIRRNGDNPKVKIHSGSNLKTLIKRLTKLYCQQKKWWNESVNGYIREHYNKDISASGIAAELSVLTGQKITKNMVIKRASYLGLGRQKNAKLDGTRHGRDTVALSHTSGGGGVGTEGDAREWKKRATLGPLVRA